MPNDYGGTTNPVKPPKYTPPKPPVLTPPTTPPVWTPTPSPYGTPTPGPFGGGYTPPMPSGPTVPQVNYNVPPSTEFSPGANPPRPPSPVGAPATGSGQPAGDYWNGYRVIQRAPNGNVLVDVNGEALAYDPWGNHIPHLFFGPGGGDPNGGAGGGGGGAAAPAPTTPALPTPPGTTPTTWYSPPTGSPYLQLPGNFLSYMSDAERSQLADTLRGAGFQATGAYSTYGPSDWLRPTQFDQNDLNSLALNGNVREWLRWFLGNMGYGLSYQLPAGYQAGSGLPTAPQYPLPPTPPGIPAPVPDPYHP